MEVNKRKYESRFKFVIYIMTIVATLFYLVYRICFTVPLGLRFIDVVFGLAVLFVELMESFEFFAYFYNVLRYRKKSPKIPTIKESDFPDVDVFIATINESTECLEDTIKACTSMNYPDKKKLHIYLCDDGDRKELRKLTRKYEIEYLARKKHEYAKAGNYNFALKNSESPFVAIFDADMRPRKDFLLKTVPFFIAKDKVGFVQTPQVFRNPDIFQSRFSTKLPCEQDYFYRYLQLARNKVNSTILCGTNCVISRRALEKVGGFAKATIAEDVATGMLIESLGYKGIAISRVLADGEAVNDVSGFLRQRSRWGRGCIQTAKSYGIFGREGLSVRQKIDYFVAIKYWLFGLRKIFFMMLPLLYVFFGVITIEGNLKIFIPLFLCQYFLKRFVIDWTEGGYKSTFWMNIYELIMAPYMAVVILGELIGVSNREFIVTQKGGLTQQKNWADGILFLSHWFLLMINCLGLALSIYKFAYFSTELYIIPMVWLTINIFYLFIVLLFDFRNNKSRNFDVNIKRKYGIKTSLSVIWRK